MRDRFEHILAVDDGAVGSDDVLVRAVCMARATGARLMVARPLGPEPSPAVVAEAQKSLARILPWINQEGVDDASTAVLVGTPYVEITRCVVQHGHDLVILGTEAGRAITDVLLGSTATQLMRKCPSAVWVVKPGRGMRRDTVLAAVEAPIGRSPEPLGAKILDLAAALARAQGGRLHVVHCWDVDGAEAEMLRSEIADDTRRAILQRHERCHRDAVESLIARHRGALDEIETHLPRGPAQPAIVSLAEQRDVGLVVMGLPSRSALSGLLVGNSVERVLDLVRCDVLAVKPDEFRTPVAVHSVGAQADLHRR